MTPGDRRWGVVAGRNGGLAEPRAGYSARCVLPRVETRLAVAVGPMYT
jgi:hypothetical protein